jgi:hypothetical protein
MQARALLVSAALLLAGPTAAAAAESAPLAGAAPAPTQTDVAAGTTRERGEQAPDGDEPGTTRVQPAVLDNDGPPEPARDDRWMLLLLQGLQPLRLEDTLRNV